MEVVVYEYPKCTTCQRALDFLDRQGIEYEKLPIRETPPSKEELMRMLDFAGGNVRKLFNTSGMLYRVMKLQEKLKTMSVEEAIELLNTHGMLIKRPFLLAENVGLLGFKEKEWEKLLE